MFGVKLLIHFQTSTVQPLKFGNGQVTSSHTLLHMWLLMHAGIKWNHVSKNGPRSLTHWGRATHICVGKLTIIGSDNGLSPGRRQAIIWTNAGILLIGPLGTKFSEILIGIQTFSFRKMHLKISSAKWRPFCLGLYELRDVVHWTVTHFKLIGAWTKWPTFCRRLFQMSFLDKTFWYIRAFWYIHSNFTEVKLVLFLRGVRYWFM